MSCERVLTMPRVPRLVLVCSFCAFALILPTFLHLRKSEILSSMAADIMHRSLSDRARPYGSPMDLVLGLQPHTQEIGAVVMPRLANKTAKYVLVSASQQAGVELTLQLRTQS